VVAINTVAGHKPSVASCIGLPIRGVAAFLIALIIFIPPADAGEGPSAFSLQMGIAAYRSGAPLHALTVFAQVAQAKPLSALPVIWAGIAATAAGRTHEAEAYFREGLRRPHSAFQERITRGWLARLEIFRQMAPASGTPNVIAALAHGSNPRLTWEQASWMGELVTAAASRVGIDPWLLAAVVYVESRFDHTSTSGAGERGPKRSVGESPWDRTNATGTLPRVRRLEPCFGSLQCRGERGASLRGCSALC
jgi:hypothetical protein